MFFPTSSKFVKSYFNFGNVILKIRSAWALFVKKCDERTQNIALDEGGASTEILCVVFRDLT